MKTLGNKKNDKEVIKQSFNPQNVRKYSHNARDDSLSQIQPKIREDSDSELEQQNYDSAFKNQST